MSTRGGAYRVQYKNTRESYSLGESGRGIRHGKMERKYNVNNMFRLDVSFQWFHDGSIGPKINTQVQLVNYHGAPESV